MDVLQQNVFEMVPKERAYATPERQAPAKPVTFYRCITVNLKKVSKKNIFWILQILLIFKLFDLKLSNPNIEHWTHVACEPMSGYHPMPLPLLQLFDEEGAQFIHHILWMLTQSFNDNDV